jgi:hypothetical protein
MQFLKKHYEKIVLGVVLLGVAATSLLLTMRASDERQRLAEQLQQKVAGQQKPVKPVDLAGSVVSLERLSKPSVVMLAGEHKTFNPGTWIRKADGGIAPVGDRGGRGAEGLALVAIHPLNLSVTYVAVAGTGDPYRYQFTVVRDYEKQASKRRPTTISLTEGTKNDLFLLREVQGPKDNPTAVVIDILEGNERVTLAKDKTYSKGMGYSGDLRYEAENKNFTGKRAEESLLLSGVSYKIVAIQKDELVVSAPNQVRTTIKLSAAP